MRGTGFPVPPGGVDPADTENVRRNVDTCCARSLPFMIVFDGHDVTITIADNHEPLETLYAFAGFKALS